MLSPNTLETLPLANANVLAMLSLVDSTGSVYVVGRSYDGTPWEGVMPTPLQFDCAAGSSCSVSLPVASAAGDTYLINLVAEDTTVTGDQEMARFLMQASFGQSRASLAEIAAMGADSPSRIAAWIDAQIATPASLHRAHFRKNSNNPGEVQVQPFGTTKACNANARYQRFAFSIFDVGLVLQLDQTAEGYNLLVEGEVRTQIASADVDAFIVDRPVMPISECSGEGGTCNSTGQVRFGGLGNYTPWQAADGLVSCDASAFGRPPPPPALSGALGPEDLREGPFVNVALNQPATHSSECCGGAAARAVDGNNGGGSWGSASCSHTNGGSTWWQVDLGEFYFIGDVNVYHRSDCCSDRLVGGSIVLSETPDYTATGIECFTLAGPPNPETGSCGGSSGRYMTVFNTGIITICEFEANGRLAPGAGIVPQVCQTRPVFSLDPEYRICQVQNELGGLIALAMDSTGCNNYLRISQTLQEPQVYKGPRLGARQYAVLQNPVTVHNPAIMFTNNAPTAPVMNLPTSTILVDGVDADVKFIESTVDPCPLPDVSAGSVTFMRHNSTYYKFDPRIAMLENSLESPTTAPAESFPFSPRGLNVCPSAPKSFLNSASCVRRPECTSPLVYEPNATFVLDDAMIRTFYELPSLRRHLHKIEGLRFELNERTGWNPYSSPSYHITRDRSIAYPRSGYIQVSPCDGLSRWTKTAGSCASDTGLDADTLASLQDALSGTVLDNG